MAEVVSDKASLIGAGGAQGAKDNPSTLPVPVQVAQLMAAAFGRLFPALVLLLMLAVVIGAVAYGIWVSVDKITSIQTNLNKAVEDRAAAQVAAAASSAEAIVQIERARTAGLKEAQDQIRKQNDDSLNFSDKLQKLIQGQLENMKRADEIAKEQARRNFDAENERSQRAQAIQTQQEEDYKRRLATLIEQIQETQKRQSQLKYDDYNALKKRVGEALKADRLADNAALQFLEEKMDDPLLAERAVADSDSEAEHWTLRVALSLALYQHSGTLPMLQKACDLTVANASSAGWAMADLFSGRGVRSRGGLAGPFMMRTADLALNPAFSAEFRERVVSGVYSTGGSSVSSLIGEERVRALARFLYLRMQKFPPQSAANCYPLQLYLSNLRNLAPEAELVYSSRLLQTTNGSEAVQACIAAAQVGGQPIQRPTEEMLARWPE